ncbi:hypothetical protein J8F10_31580 [Gemmata sp. G18]|uniref:Glycosyltransferase RgtA/B/C/D-like domain-containing protein n=1 Tax=Gemmata palustris TaxID=2822762 RepID=A0ABS5C1G4_9BACT|nr:hypothetical protein [Gemmata palustris]MBP3959812.1 hypothetical protein [Gemmata palustris]
MAVLLTWALFVGWAVIGTAVLKLARFRWTTVTLLLAPTIGFVTLVIPTYILVRFEVPVRLSAAPVGGALLAGALGVLWRARPTAARARGLWRRARVFAVVLVGAFGLTAWPLFGYGFDWVANGNDDMANYCLMATGYREHGFVEPPTLDGLTEGRDPTRAYWFGFIMSQVRPGSDLLLALVSAWTGLSAQQVFMPTIVALNLSLVASAGALAGTGIGRRGAAVACALLAVSAASTYGVVQQLIGQVSGLAVLCAALVLLCGRFRRLRWDALLRRGGVCGVLLAGLSVFYPEVIPILVGACVVVGVWALPRRTAGGYLAHAAVAIVVMVALLPVYMHGIFGFLVGQSKSGTSSSTIIADIFPYFLTPRGPALVWGLLPIAGPESPLLQNVCIALGAALLAAILVPFVTSLRRRRTFAAALVVAAALAATLYVQRSAFGLFKIAMFAQPFLWAVAAGWVVSRRAQWGAVVAAVLVAGVAGLNARTQFWYVDQSRGREARGDLPAANTRQLLSEFRTAHAARVARGEVDRVLLATENNVLLKLFAAEIRGVPVGQIGYAPFDDMAYGGLRLIEQALWVRLHPEQQDALVGIRTGFYGARERNSHTITHPDTGLPLHRLEYPTWDRSRERPERVMVAAGGGCVSVLNRHYFPETGPPLIYAPLTDLKNFAVFCDASGARQHFIGGITDPENVALFLLEGDPMFRPRTMAGVGHAVVLDVLNPSPQVRVLVSCTNSYSTDPVRRNVAPVQLFGDRSAAFGSIGAGAARLVSPPVAPQAVGSSRYLALGFGAATRNPNRLCAAEQLWGAGLARDRRMLATHARDISVLSEEDYAAFRPPQQIAKFPGDLAHPHLEYSGFYEEGWVDTEFKIRLAQPAPDQEAVIRGMIPQVSPTGSGFRTEVTVLVDGMPVEKRVLSVGNFELRAPGGAGTGPRWIEVRFSADQALPAPDERRVVAHLASVGFEPKNEALSRPPEKIGATPADLSHPKANVLGIAADGWGEKALSVRLWQAGPDRDAVVRGEVPDVARDGTFRTELTVLIDGTEVAKRALAPGAFEVRAPAGGKMAQARGLECRFSNTQVLPHPDGRAVGAHLRFVGFEPTQPSP